MARKRVFAWRTALLTVAGGLALAGALAAATATKRVERTLPLLPGGKVEVKNLQGGIVLEGWDHPEVAIVIQKTVEAAREAWAREALEGLKVRIASRPDRIVVESLRAEQGGVLARLVGGPSVIRIDYVVRVPTTATVLAETVDGDVSLEDLSGIVTASSTNGNVRLVDCPGRVAANTVNGNLVIVLDRVARTTDLEATSVNGNVLLEIPATANADVDARTVHGCVASEVAVEGPGKRSRSRLIGQLNEGGGAIRLRTTNGTVLVRNPPN